MRARFAFPAVKAISEHHPQGLFCARTITIIKTDRIFISDKWAHWKLIYSSPTQRKEACGLIRFEVNVIGRSAVHIDIRQNLRLGFLATHDSTSNLRSSVRCPHSSHPERTDRPRGWDSTVTLLLVSPVTEGSVRKPSFAAAQAVGARDREGNDMRPYR